MKEWISVQIQQKMLPHLNNEQLLILASALNQVFIGLSISRTEHEEQPQPDLIPSFISAKRIEGCSEKTLTYYQNTLNAMVNSIGKTPQQMTTDDIRTYLTNYQSERKTSKVTGVFISAFFHGWKMRITS